jgi:type IV pilus assembly protein PilE
MKKLTMQRVTRGFTLIELMIAVAIAGILATIAYPSYSDYVIRGKIPEATTALQETRVRMEQYFLDNRSYRTAAGACGALPADVAAHATTGPYRYFTLSCASTANDNYTVTATGAMGGMVGFSYTINQANARTSTITAPPGWVTALTPCWITRKGGGC